MAKESRRIPFEEFSENLSIIFAEVINNHKTVVIESEYGELVEIKPITPASTRRQTKDREDEEAFLASAGSWADFDIDAFLKANEESRKVSTRPAIDL